MATSATYYKDQSDLIDPSIDPKSPHWQRLEGEPFAIITKHTTVLRARVSPCAQMIYEWLLLRGPAGVGFPYNRKDFQSYSAESRGTPYSIKQIRRAENELIAEGVMDITDFQRVVRVRHVGPATNARPTRTKMSQQGQERDTKKTRTRSTKASQDSTEIQTKKIFKNTVGVFEDESIQLSLFDLDQGAEAFVDQSDLQVQAEVQESWNTAEILDEINASDAALSDKILKKFTLLNILLTDRLASSIREGLQSKLWQLNRRVDRCSTKDPSGTTLRGVVDAFYEYEARSKVECPLRFLIAGLVEGREYKPNVPGSVVVKPEGFDEWFRLAVQLKLVREAYSYEQTELLIPVPGVDADELKSYKELKVAFPIDELRLRVVALSEAEQEFAGGAQLDPALSYQRSAPRPQTVSTVDELDDFEIEIDAEGDFQKEFLYYQYQLQRGFTGAVQQWFWVKNGRVSIVGQTLVDTQKISSENSDSRHHAI